MAEVGQNPIFTDQPTVHPCTWAECVSGHKWPIQAMIAACPGCNGAVLAIRQSNCHYCNEPMLRVTMRHDFVPTGAGVVPRCKGATVYGETLDGVIQRNGAAEAEKSHLSFEERVKEENARKTAKTPAGSSGEANSSNLG